MSKHALGLVIGFGITGVAIAACSSDDSPPRSGGAASSSSSGNMASSSSGASSSGASSSSGEGGMGGSGGTCSNGQKDGQETDVDCGGPACLNCVGAACGDSKECASQSCVNGKCVPPSCSDKVKNGNETDVDCGGADCANCADNLGCVVSEDCVSGICSSGLCFPPSCSDGVSNGNESGIDCGGTVCTKCPPGANCRMGVDCLSNTCLSNKCVCPPGMITASTAGNVTYCIDQTEVTNKAYVAFVNTPNLPPQDPVCSWNATYVPSNGFPGAALEYFPVVKVDWCDAYAYCKAQGKHLCGGLGATSVDYNAFADPSASIWYNACSGQGNSTYPYGSQFVRGTCVGAPETSTKSPYTPQGTLLMMYPCLGNFPNLYDMSGNAAEWEDSCDAQTGASDNCRIRGGSYGSDTTDLACAADAAMARSTTSDKIGFRCCQ
jgi:Sulfatase-modifying factor enzyme 1